VRGAAQHICPPVEDFDALMAALQPHDFVSTDVPQSSIRVGIDICTVCKQRVGLELAPVNRN
jgi:hypothetical protein